MAARTKSKNNSIPQIFVMETPNEEDNYQLLAFGCNDAGTCCGDGKYGACRGVFT